MTNLNVGVFGAAGKMGSTVCQAINKDDCTSLRFAIDTNQVGSNIPNTEIFIRESIETLEGVDVVVDFTVAEVAMENIKFAARQGVHAVVGTSGLTEINLSELSKIFTKSNCIIVPNFSISAILLMRLSEIATPYFSTIEIIEFHHNNKIDAPSGTALATAERISEVRNEDLHDSTTNLVIDGARGAKGQGNIPIHSVRMEGMLAHQEVIFGATGQTLTIRQDSSDRSSFMPGVLMAIKGIEALSGVNVGLENLMDA
ncbi:MAG: 4-hydroxy-tetrahydrodipicolinate reductase [Acidimicrobiaceae bacterium]|jgi:4-hydroxy-tetrahydrodipicolinate reductase|nr:4-hydroxy-tetrahydrodipicolinate reductase [Acidimicrobiaceae bacterium]|tara:strand:+ start:226 stop:996 length:771 start_codon:yes stop_codon:yes gene_type:complete